MPLRTNCLVVGTFAIGFTSADFIIWDLENDTKVTHRLEVATNCSANVLFQICIFYRWFKYHVEDGGALILIILGVGTVPEYQNCFAFVKDHIIHIRRHWARAQDNKLLPQVLHMRFHGREVHSLCFIEEKCILCCANVNQFLR